MSSQIDYKMVFGLDVPKTTAQINTDLKKVQRQLSDVKIPGRLDSSLEHADKTLKNTERSMRSIDQLCAKYFQMAVLKYRGYLFYLPDAECREGAASGRYTLNTDRRLQQRPVTLRPCPVVITT